MSDYQRIADAIQYIEANRQTQPDLEELADYIGLSSFHLHRLFSKWAGITPKAFLQCLNLEHARGLLTRGESVLDATLASGLSSPSRLHDLCVTLERATPGEIKSGGHGWNIACGFADTPFGNCLVGQNKRGVCHMSFEESDDQTRGLTILRQRWPGATLKWNGSAARRIASQVFTDVSAPCQRAPLRTIVQGTDFQVRVWRALLEIPTGSLVSYSRIAEGIGKPTATRAVASAIARNDIAYLIPCHRVIRESGAISNYRWGPARKKAMIVWETHARDCKASDSARGE